MSGGGGKGGSSTTTQEIPDWVKEPAQRNLARAEEISQIGYTPYYGPDVAAFTPQQMSAFNNTNDMASAYGMGGGGVSVPEPTTFANGMQGYSSAPLYEEAVGALQTNRPGQYDAIMAQFINPQTGVSPTATTAQTTADTNALSDVAAFNLSQAGNVDGHGVGPSGSLDFGGIGGNLGDISGLNGDFSGAFGGGGIGGVSPDGGSGGGFGGNK